MPSFAILCSGTIIFQWLSSCTSFGLFLCVRVTESRGRNADVGVTCDPMAWTQGPGSPWAVGLGPSFYAFGKGWNSGFVTAVTTPGHMKAQFHRGLFAWLGSATLKSGSRPGLTCSGLQKWKPVSFHLWNLSVCCLDWWGGGGIIWSKSPTSRGVELGPFALWHSSKEHTPTR